VTRDIRGKEEAMHIGTVSLYGAGVVGGVGGPSSKLTVSAHDLEENFFSQEILEANTCVSSRSPINCEAQECVRVRVCTSYTRPWRGDETHRAVVTSTQERDCLENEISRDS
jgi:hypothetical protein